jgi:hypothetical protein
MVRSQWHGLFLPILGLFMFFIHCTAVQNQV